MGAVSHVMSAHKIAFARAEEQRAGVGVVTHSSSERTHANEYHHDRRQGRSARRACGRSPSTPLAHSDSIAPQIGGFWTSGWVVCRAFLPHLLAARDFSPVPCSLRFPSAPVCHDALPRSQQASGAREKRLLQRWFRQSRSLVFPQAHALSIRGHV